MAIIEPPRSFLHAGELPLRADSYDPRGMSFPEMQVDVDLRQCEFVGVPAALWCAIYLLLAKGNGSECRLLVPQNMGVCIYLKSLGLFKTLQDNGIEADDRGIDERSAPQLVLPLTRFDNESQVDEITNNALESLQDSGLGASNLYSLVSEIFAELAMNAVQHADSSIGAYGVIQFYISQNGERFVCGIADGGIGIRRSLDRNPTHKEFIPYDWTAIEYALREQVSGTEDSYRGFGLFGVSEEMRNPGRQLIIHSGIGSLQVTEELESASHRTRLFPGTLAYVSIPT